MTTMMTTKIQGHLSQGPLPFPVDRNKMLMTFAVFLLATTTTTTLVQAVPARMLSSGTNKIISTSSQSASALNPANHSPLPHISSIPEEELELESLKGTGGDGGSSSLSKKSEGGTISSTADSSSSTSKPVAYVKKPENEETPALSDNANSLKYGGATADFEEALANMAHIPPSKSPSLSVKSSGGLGAIGGGGGGGYMSSGFPLGDYSMQQKRARSTSYYDGGSSSNSRGDGGRLGGLLSRTGALTGVNLEVDYTPQDIAEYIFWLGDERGVELALSDFVQDGLITAQDAVRFLEDVKVELSLLRNRYASTVSLGRNGISSSGMDITNSHDERGFWDVPARTMNKKQSAPSSSSYFNSIPSSSSNSYFSGSSGSSNSGGYYSPSNSVELMSNNPYYPSSSSPSSSSYRSSYGNLYKDSAAAATGAMKSSSSATSTNSVEDMLDYEEIVEKLRQADSKMREVALEGIIYQLARELFSMGLQQSSGSSVPAFTKFIENLSVNGNISKDLERSVLETLVQALVDAANERGLLNAKSSSSSSSSSSPSLLSSSSSIESQLSSLTGKSSAHGSGTPKPISIKKKSV